MAFNSGEKTELGEAKHYDQNIKIVSKNYETFFTLHRFVQREVLEVTQFCKDRNLAYFMQQLSDGAPIGLPETLDKYLIVKW